jgi:hypothetical protein
VSDNAVVVGPGAQGLPSRRFPAMAVLAPER